MAQQPAALAASLAVFLIVIHLLSLILAAGRLSRRGHLPAPDFTPPVSIIVPVRGIEAFSSETLAQAFALDWPDYELLFCVAHGDDPIAVSIRAAIDAHPDAHPNVPSRLLVGEDRISGNPKLNNCAKGWHAAKHEWVILADSNVLMPSDYIQSLMAAVRADTGLVCSMPIGSRPDGFWAEVECAYLNTFQARWQYAGETIGKGFAQGKSMLWRKSVLDANGGIEALAAEVAEDAAATKLVNRLGLKVHLVDAPFEQPLGRRAFQDIWLRQVRWARLRRVTFPLYFVPEILLGALPPLALALIAAALADVSLPLTALAVLVAMYPPEYALAAAKGWHRTPRLFAAMAARDIIMPVVWLRAWFDATIEWRGNPLDIRAGVREAKEAA